MTQIDEKYLQMNAEDYNCMAVVSSQTYNSDGVMFEYTQSRHRPDYFRFYDNAVRKVAAGMKCVLLLTPISNHIHWNQLQ